MLAWGDEIWLQRALQNLIVNAIYYSPRGSAPIAVRLWREDQWIAISVSDSGRGISEEDQAQIFERYYRVSASAKHSSSGLGLSIAHRIAEQHRGELTVQSELGAGSCFTMRLPLWSTEVDSIVPAENTD